MFQVYAIQYPLLGIFLLLSLLPRPVQGTGQDTSVAPQRQFADFDQFLNSEGTLSPLPLRPSLNAQIETTTDTSFSVHDVYRL